MLRKHQVPLLQDNKRTIDDTMDVLTFYFIIAAVILNFIQISEALLSPSTTPEQIILSQLASLQKDDMNGVYEFASPANKQRTGDVITFGNMVRTGPYKYLVGHKKADILLESTMVASKQYLVRVVPSESLENPSKRVVEYWWSLSRCNAGPHAGCYLVDAVIPNSL
jgi:hypothetical protein